MAGVGLYFAMFAGHGGAAHAQDGAQPLELGRFVVAQISADRPADIRAQLSFQVLISIVHSDWDWARSSVPAYRDIVIRTAYGYAAYAARNGISPTPDRLAALIATRIGEEEGLPAPLFITLPNFQEVRPSSQNGVPHGPR